MLIIVLQNMSLYSQLLNFKNLKFFRWKKATHNLKIPLNPFMRGGGKGFLPHVFLNNLKTADIRTQKLLLFF